MDLLAPVAHGRGRLRRPGRAADNVLILSGFDPEVGRVVGQVGHHGHERDGDDRGTPFGTNPLANSTGADKNDVLAAINAKWNNRSKAAIGYIGSKEGALPALR